MGSFSFLKCRKVKEDETVNFAEGDRIRMLIPRKYGISEIKGIYDGFGVIDTGHGIKYDIFEIHAIINGVAENGDGEKITKIKPIDEKTDAIRFHGIYLFHNGRVISGYVTPQAEFPLKLTDDDDIKYEECYGESLSDPSEGCPGYTLKDLKEEDMEEYKEYEKYMEIFK